MDVDSGNSSAIWTTPPSLPPYLMIDSKKALPIPALMFSLGVFGNGLAIVSLLMYKYRKVRPHSPMTYSSAYTGSPNMRDQRNDEIENGEAGTQRKQSAAFRAKNDIKFNERRKRKHKFGPFHTLVLALISVDLFGNLATSPLTIYLYSSNITILTAGGEPLCNYSAFAMMFLGIVTMASLTTMAIERVLSIQCPYFYHRHISSKTANIAIAIILVSCAIFSALPTIGFGKIRPMFPYTWCFADWYAVETKDMVYNYIYASFGVLMILTTLVCNGTVVYGLFKMKSRVTSTHSRKNVIIRRETQMIIQLVVMTCIYLVCWLPLMITILDNQLRRRVNASQDRIAIWLAAANPILDPWVYILLRRSVVQRLVKFAKSTCLPGVQNKLKIVVSAASPNNNDLSKTQQNQDLTIRLHTNHCFLDERSSWQSGSSSPQELLEVKPLKISNELSSSYESLYDNAQ